MKKKKSNTFKEDDIFKRKLISNENALFVKISISLLFLYFIFLYEIQFYIPKNLKEEDISRIRKRYIKILYGSNLTGQTVRFHRIEKHKTWEAGRSTNDIKGKTPKRGLIGMETIIINPYQSTVDTLLSDILQNPDYSYSTIDLDALLNKVREYQEKAPFVPGLDITKQPELKLNLEKTYSPKIDTTRIKNEILMAQAPRSRWKVEQIIRKNEPLIQYCFRKFQYEMKNKYTIRVEFAIDYRGFVISQSVKILETNITNPKLLKCIRLAIMHWKNFGEIKEKHLVYRVRQKWIF